MRTPQIKPFEMDWKSMERTVPDWFRDAKFGLFFHWAPYCVPACENEWYSRNMYAKGLSQNKHHINTYGPISEFGYKDFYKDFKGEKFDPEAWADLIVRSGAKYAGPVTEHTDNFSLWNSQINPINAVNYGPKRDVVGELEKTIRARGLNFIATFHHQWLWGWFMSSDPDADVYDPENEIFYGKPLPLETCRYMPWQLPDDEFNQVWMQKVIEVIDNYNPDMIYFDSRANIIDEKYKHKFLEHYYKGAGNNKDRLMCYKQTDFPKDTGIEDFERGRCADIKEFAWQTDDRLEAKTTWCYIEGAKYRPAIDIIQQLCDVVSKNGNLLLNVGPKEDGTFAEEALTVLYEVGDWLKLNGEAIYGTRPFTVFGEGSTKVEDANFDTAQIEAQTRKGTFDDEADAFLTSQDIRFTTKGNTVYAILMGSPENGRITIKSLAEGEGLASKTISRIDLIGGASGLEWSRSVQDLTVTLKGEVPSEKANVLRVVFA